MKSSRFEWSHPSEIKLLIHRKGGPGSGNFGHAGRPGEVGGSAPDDTQAPNYDHIQFTDAGAGKLRFNRSEILQLCGVPSGFRGAVRIRVNNYDYKEKGVIEVEVKSFDNNDALDGKVFMNRLIFKDHIINEHFYIDDSSPWRGHGSEMFNTQVEFAARKGFKYLSAYAVGTGQGHPADRGSNNRMIGYYVWGRVGYRPDKRTLQAPYFLSKMAEWHRHIGNVQSFDEMMATPVGRDWWFKNGVGWDGEFDLKEGSHSRNTLKAYMAERVAKDKKFAKIANTKGGPGSGNHGHAGRPGEVGGSAPSGYGNLRGLSIMGGGQRIGAGMALEQKLDTKVEGDFTIRDCLKMAGIPEDYDQTVSILGVGSSHGINVMVDSGSGNTHFTMARILDFRNKSCENLDFAIGDKHPKKGQGTELFAAQVKALRAAGFKKIETVAAGELNSDYGYNGYYTWARCGYRPKHQHDEDDFVGQFQGDGGEAESFHEMMATEVGRRWWRQHGGAFRGVFDLDPDSRSSKMLDAYIEERAQRKAKKSAKGGEGSGNFGHAGRDGLVGGSRKRYQYVSTSVENHVPADAGLSEDKWLQGMSRHEVLRLAGVPADYRGSIVIEVLTGIEDGRGRTLYVRTINDTSSVGGISLKRYLRFRPDGSKICNNDTQIIPDGSRYKGRGTELFAAQVRALRAAGFTKITASLAGNKKRSSWNGYYSWARVGYLPSHQAVEEHWVNKFKAAGKTATTFADIIATAEGRAWWKEHGDGFHGEFDLADGSYSMRTLEGYLKERQARGKDSWWSRLFKKELDGVAKEEYILIQ